MTSANVSYEAEVQALLNKSNPSDTLAESPAVPSTDDHPAAETFRRISSLDVLHAYFSNRPSGAGTTGGDSDTAASCENNFTQPSAIFSPASQGHAEVPIGPNAAAATDFNPVFPGIPPVFSSMVNVTNPMFTGSMPPTLLSAYFAGAQAGMPVVSSVPTSAAGGCASDNSGDDDCGAREDRAAADTGYVAIGDADHKEEEEEEDDMVPSHKKRRVGVSSRSGRRPAATVKATAGNEANPTTRARKERRMLSNRESARRSRLRKQQHMANMEADLAAVSAERDALRAQVAKLQEEVASVRAEMLGLQTGQIASSGGLKVRELGGDEGTLKDMSHCNDAHARNNNTELDIVEGL